MKKLLPIIILFLILGCSDEKFIEPSFIVDVPISLKIKEKVGIKTESIIVSDEVKINVKLPYSGKYRIKIRDIDNELVSHEIINANEGDNLLKAYVKTLSKSSYVIQLTDFNHEVLGTETIVVN